MYWRKYIQIKLFFVFVVITELKQYDKISQLCLHLYLTGIEL